MGEYLEDGSIKKDINDHFRDWESHVFGFGYGTGEPPIIDAMVRFFGLLEDNRGYDYRRLEGDIGALSTWLLINTLCHADILEYGTSPRYGWLTKKGERLRDFFAAKSVNDVLEILNYDQDYINCGPDTCNCGPHGYLKGLVCKNPFWLKDFKGTIA